MDPGEETQMPQTRITQSGITLTGKTYTGGLFARAIHPDGRPYHTFRTATVEVFADDVRFENCRFANTAGPGERVGQALALYLDGDGITLEDCILTGYQDTLFLAPLPEKEYEKDGFLGPGRDLPRIPRTVIFERCRIEGSIDFVFGGATAYFYDCEFRSLGPGYVFAPCTPPQVKTGFAAINCRFTAAEGVPNQSCYIARPWRDDGAVRLENCYLGPHIHPDGWHDWGKKSAWSRIRFSEKNSYGPGAGTPRPPYVRVEN